MPTCTKYQSVISLDVPFLGNALIVLFASMVLALISQISINWQPVPLTLQSAMVVLLGLSIGSKRAACAVALYLLEGAFGLPVFAGGAFGFQYLIGPSAGYLWGFVPAAFLAGWMMEQGMCKHFITIFITALLSSSVIFLFGVLHLMSLIGLKQAILVGMNPFLLSEPVKLLGASVMAKFCYKQL